LLIEICGLTANLLQNRSWISADVHGSFQDMFVAGEVGPSALIRFPADENERHGLGRFAVHPLAATSG
jgi:hypothetical protein